MFAKVVSRDERCEQQHRGELHTEQIRSVQRNADLLGADLAQAGQVHRLRMEHAQQFAEQDSRASRSVFDVRATNPVMIPADADKPRMLEIIYGQLPQRIAPEGFVVERHEMTLYGVCSDCHQNVQ